MSSGCESDRYGNPVLLDSVAESPHRLESDCWYSVASSVSLRIPAVIERPSVDEKMAVYWENMEFLR